MWRNSFIFSWVQLVSLYNPTGSPQIPFFSSPSLASSARPRPSLPFFFTVVFVIPVAPFYSYPTKSSRQPARQYHPPPRIPLLTDRDIPKEFPSRRKSDYFRSNLHLTHSLCWASFTRQRQFPPWSARFPPVPIDLATHLRQNHILKRQANGPLLPAAPNKSPGRRSLIDLPSPARPPNLVSPTELALSSFLPSQPPIPIQAGILQRAFSQGLADAHRRQRGPAWRTFRDDRARPATSKQ